MNAGMVIAHRGASSRAPENTCAAFDLALQLGARDIELDVHLSRDDHVVIIHDDRLDRTTNGSGPVADHTLAELRRLDAGSWFGAAFAGERIPALDEVLGRYKGRAHLHIEIKGRTPKLVPRTAELIRRHGMARDVTITSFQEERLVETRACAPELPAGWLVVEVGDAAVARARALGLIQFCPRADHVTPVLVRRLHAEGFAVRAWGVSNEELMRQLVEAGVNGMTVDSPDKLIAYLRGLAPGHDG